MTLHPDGSQFRVQYLGYKQPLGPHLRYFLLDRHGRRLGCLLFSQATRSLLCRDAWVGWQQGAYKKHLDLVVAQPRFLLFPWVHVRFLASKCRRSLYFGRNPGFLVRLRCRRNDWR